MKELEKLKTKDAKDRRIALKVARAVQQEERKKWNKNRPVQHSYGEAEGEVDSESDNEDEDEDEADREEEEAKAALDGTAMPREESATVISISRKSCVCGGTDHMRRSSKKCPQNPKMQKD
ncbi:PREDICTED: calreticulin-like [Branchiostoma belcheri]|uniref:Calreticulin-like n=1 Tax=Branchiostoma belcheri TaxID=7741 RepID=A0A6P4YSW7_BRABE|nr:PREDICTED: calreticulin-like [Branchiostoma belcheri]